MATSRGPEQLNTTVDLGAQFISVTPQIYQAHKRYTITQWRRQKFGQVGGGPKTQ